LFRERDDVGRGGGAELAEERVMVEGGRGRGTLSVSIVATSSSAATISPSFFVHDLSVPSLMDSAI